MTIITQEQKQEVCGLLNWTEEQHSNFMFETGVDFLDAYCTFDCKTVNQVLRADNSYKYLLTNRAFWNWWKMQWQARDEVFVDHFNWEWTDHNSRLMLYRELHNPKVLSCELAIPRVIFKDYGTVEAQLL